MQEFFTNFFAKIDRVKTIGIVVHTKPDGDALGSMSAMAILLEKMGKKVIMYAPHVYPDNYSFLPYSRAVRTRYKKEDNLEVLIALDCGSTSRIEQFEDIRAGGPFIINIDHHMDNTQFGDLNWVAQYASVGEMIYDLAAFRKLNINKDVATCLYVSIYTDTGGFRFANTSARCLFVASKLMEIGVELPEVLSSVYEKKKFTEIKDLGDTLGRVQINEQGTIVWTVQKENAQDLSFEVIDFLRMVDGVEVAVVFKETSPKHYKLSFRAKTDVDVSKIAANFGGGGHKAAAGANIDGEEQEVIKKVIDYIQSLI